MARSPYYRGPSTSSQKVVASTSPWKHEGSNGSRRMGAKRRSSVIDDISFGGPTSRISQKVDVLLQHSSLSKHKCEFGSGHKLLLRNEPEPRFLTPAEENVETSKRNLGYGSVSTESCKMASKIFEQLDRMSPKEKPSVSRLAGITEKINSPKFLSSSQDNKKQGQDPVWLPDARESTSQISFFLSSMNRNCTEPVRGKTPIVTNTCPTSMVPAEPSQKKQTFLMSLHGDHLELDDGNHSNGHVFISSGENKKPETSVFAYNDVSNDVPEVDKIPGILQSSVVINQKMGFNFFGATSSSTNTQSSFIFQSTSIQKEPTVSQTIGTSTNTVGPSGVKPNISPDAKPLGSTSLINSALNNNQQKFSVQ